jgi:hypothetical protein
LIRLRTDIPDAEQSHPLKSIRVRFVFAGTGTNITRAGAATNKVSPSSTTFSMAGAVGVDFAQPGKPPGECFDPTTYSGGGLRLASFVTTKAHADAARGIDTSSTVEKPMQWVLTVDSTGHSFEAISAPITLAPGGSATTYIAVSSITPPALRREAIYEELLTPDRVDAAWNASLVRWNGYLRDVLQPRQATKGGGAPPSKQRWLSASMAWTAVKSLETLIHNWRTVPGVGEGVLPSWNNYDSGMWSWDTYKQAVGMARFAPALAMNQLRLLVAGRDYQTDKLTGQSLPHIPDKVDRCGRGGGCAGKPPLLSWSVWGVFNQTADQNFLAEMYPILDGFHRWWYHHRDTLGIGLCSWTGGMESGMDDGIRFTLAGHASNKTSGVSSFNFHSIDLNAYLYKEKRTLAAMAKVLGNASGARHWTAEADALLPRLQQHFFKPDASGGGGFFQDRYFNGSFVPVQVTETDLAPRRIGWIMFGVADASSTGMQRSS